MLTRIATNSDKSKDILISVVVPAFNVAPYLRRCIDSILAQSHERLEVLCVDDGSSDETGVLLDEYAKKDSRIRVIHKKNNGVTAARLDGVKQANGEFIGFVDGDDVIDADMYERLAEALVANGADIAHCGHVMLLEGRIVEYACTYGKGDLVEAGEEAVNQLIRGQIEPGLWNKLYNRNLFDKLLGNGRMDRSITNLEDLLMNFYLFEQAKTVAYVDFVPYKYILRKGSATSGPSANIYENAHNVLQILLEETRAKPELNNSVFERYILLIIAMAEKPLGGVDGHIAAKAREELKAALSDPKSKCCSKGVQLRAKATASHPAMCRTLHAFYSTAKGTKNKYAL